LPGSQYIYGGQKTIKGAWPWLVALQKQVNGKVEFLCGGSLISNVRKLCFLKFMFELYQTFCFVILKHSFNQFLLASYGIMKALVSPLENKKKLFFHVLVLDIPKKPVRVKKISLPRGVTAAAGDKNLSQRFLSLFKTKRADILDMFVV
jgi:hypothetical protein